MRVAGYNIGDGEVRRISARIELSRAVFFALVSRRLWGLPVS